MSTNKITRAAVVNAGQALADAIRAESGTGAAAERYLRVSDREAGRAAESNEVHAAHAALAAATYVDSVGDEAMLTKAGKPVVSRIHEDVLNRGLVTVGREMFNKRVKSGRALIEAGYSVMDLAALESGILDAYRAAALAQRSATTGETTAEPRTDDRVETTEPEPEPVTVTESEPVAAESAGAEILARAEQIARNLGNVALTEAERMAIREALETALAALEVAELVAA